jgi:hypothetical protein
MPRLAKKLSAGAAFTVAATGLFAPAAFASGSSSVTTARQTADLAAIKAKAAAAISVRESALGQAVTAVTNNPYLTTADRTAVLSTFTADQSGLSALAPVIQADTTVTQAASDYRSIFTAFRVFALRLPQARFAASADDLTGTVLPRLTNAQSTLQALLSGPDSGKDTPTVQAAMADLAAQINAITSDTRGLSSTVLAFTPDQYNADPAILADPRSQLITARADARKAEADIRTVLGALK